MDGIPSPTANTPGDNVLPMFSMRAVENKKKSLDEGRPIFDEREWVEIRIPGDKSTVISRPVTDQDRQRWRAQHEAFKNGHEQPLTGTPLAEWPILSTSRVAELRASSILTVEALAELNDDAVMRLGPGGRDLQNQAKAFIEQAKGMVGHNKLASLLTQAQQEIAGLKAQIAKIAGDLGEVPRETSDGGFYGRPAASNTVQVRTASEAGSTDLPQVSSDIHAQVEGQENTVATSTPDGNPAPKRKRGRPKKRQ